jgi:hypothetical protein
MLQSLNFQNLEILSRNNAENITMVIKSRGMRWAVYGVYVEWKNVQKILDRKANGKRPLGAGRL